MRNKLIKLRELLGHVKMESCSFSCDTDEARQLLADIKASPNGGFDGRALTEFIREKTRLWRQSWIIPVVEEMIHELEANKERRAAR